MNDYKPHMATKVRSPHIMDNANGKPCTLRLSSLFPGHRCSEGTTVGCHLPVSGKGKSTKATDLAVSYGCSHCHDILDPERDWKRAEYIREHYPLAFCDRLINSIMETHAMLVDDGLIVVPGARIIPGF